MALTSPIFEVGARHRDAVAVRRAGRAPHEMIPLVDGEHEQRVALVDARVREVVEELLEGVVVGLELRHVARLAWSERPRDPAGEVIVVRVRDVRVRNRDTGLLHGEHVRERDPRLHAVEAREADVGRGRRVLDDIAVEVLQRVAGTDQHRRGVLVAEESHEAAVAVGLVGEHVGLAVVRRRASIATLSAVDGDAHEVGERLTGIRADLGRLGRARLRRPSARRGRCSRAPRSRSPPCPRRSPPA